MAEEKTSEEKITKKERVDDIKHQAVLPKEKTEKPSAVKKVAKEKARIPEMKLFDRWDSNVEVNDLGLRGYITVSYTHLTLPTTPYV